MERMEGASRDEVSANVEALKKVFPAAVKEGKVDMEALKTLLGGEVAADTGCYRMTWNGKEAARQFALKRSRGTLLPDRGSSREWETTQNVYIEGDNLEVLKLLQGGYYNSVKMIYIDPPYNTGKDFVYHDNFHDSIENYKKLTGQVNAKGAKLKTNVETSGRYHTDWLNMIFPRILVAYNLLKENGIMFISIDDNEVGNLRKVCDDVFGEENFVAQLVWDLGTGTQAGHFVRAHEYVLAYFKDKSLTPNFKGGEGVIEHSALKKISQKNPASEFSFKAGTRWDAPDGTVLSGTWGDSEATTLVSGKMECCDGKLKNDVVLSAGWCMAAQMRSWFAGQETFDSKGQLVKSFYFNEKGVLRYEKDRSVINPPTVLKNVGSTKNGTDEVVALMGLKVFDYPKPTTLCGFLAELTTTGDDIVIDMFSGSSSFADAIMQLNANDKKGSRRRYIAIQMPEDLDLALTYAEENAKQTLENGISFCAGLCLKHTLCEIGKERIRRAGDKVMAEWTARQNEAAGQLALGGAADATKRVPPDIGFRVFRLDTSNFADWNPNSEDLAGDLLKAKENVLVGRTKEDILYEVVVKCNFQLTDKITEHKVGNNAIYAVRNGELMVCIDDQIPLEVGDEMLRLKHEVYGNPESFRAVFLDNGLSDDSKANIVQRLKGDGVDETCIRCV